MDQLLDLVDKYKDLPPWRFLVVFIVCAAVAAYMEYGGVTAKEVEVQAAVDRLDAITVKYNREKGKKNDMPLMEEKLAFTRQQLEEAKKRLPDTYEIESILEAIAINAKGKGVQILSFKPGQEAAQGDGFRYFQMPIEIEVLGKFTNLASFFDEIVHMEKMVRLKDVSLVKDEIAAGGFGERKLTPSEKLRADLDKIRVKSNATVFIFRSAAPGESTMNTNDNKDASGDENEG